jgi:hypothetical protein
VFLVPDLGRKRAPRDFFNRLTLPRTPVNRGNKEGRGYYTPGPTVMLGPLEQAQPEQSRDERSPAGNPAPAGSSVTVGSSNPRRAGIQAVVLDLFAHLRRPLPGQPVLLVTRRSGRGPDGHVRGTHRRGQEHPCQGLVRHQAPGGPRRARRGAPPDRLGPDGSTRARPAAESRRRVGGRRTTVWGHPLRGSSGRGTEHREDRGRARHRDTAAHHTLGRAKRQDQS